MEELKKIKECPDCASMNILYSQMRDQVICRDCGLIFEPLVPEINSKVEKSHSLKGKQAKSAPIKKKAKQASKKKPVKSSKKRR
ncbi:hypothetical protein HY837_00760 [archaeon]|nr:hypothetical protein [archaeon]